MRAVTDQVSERYCSALQESSYLNIIRIFEKLNEKLGHLTIDEYGWISNGN